MRPIDADALKDELELADFETDSRMFGGQTVLFEDSVFKIVDSAPTLSPDDVRGVGEWIEKEVYNIENTTIEQMQSASCSVCGKIHTTPFSYYFDNFNYCPNCGARLGNGGTDDS